MSDPHLSATRGQRYALLAGLVVAVYLMLSLFASVLLPFVAAACIAYFLDPLASRLVRLGLPRSIAAAVMIVAMLTGMLLFALLFYPLLVAQIGILISRAPDYTTELRAFANLQIAKLESDPATAAYAPILRADLAMVLRKFPIAAELYVEQIKQHPTTDLVVNAASAYGASQQPTRAAEVMDEWLKSNPNDARVLHMASDLKIATGKNDEAISMLERLNESEPDNPVTMNNLAWMYATKKDPRALALARRAFVLQPTAPNADTLGWILVQSKQAAAAVPLLSQAVAVLKGDPTVQFHYATALAQSGKRLEAMTIVRPLAEQETAFPEQEDARKLVRELRDN